MLYVRLDDFPQGDPTRWNKETYRDTVKEVLTIFEEEGVPYVLGASPFLLIPEDIDMLNETVKVGNVCMHGFDHHFSFKPK